MPIGINLLPWRARKQQRERRQRRQKLLLAAFSGCLLSVLAWLPVKAWHHYQAQTNQALAAEANERAEARATHQRLHQEIKQLTEYHQQQQAIAAAQKNWLDALSAIIQADTKTTTLTRIEQTDARWRIAGRMTDAAALPALLEQLDSHERFRDVTIEFVEPPGQANDNAVRFAITPEARMP